MEKFINLCLGISIVLTDIMVKNSNVQSIMVFEYLKELIHFEDKRI